MSLLILSFIINFQPLALNSCQVKLQEKKWPIDCFLALNMRKYSVNSDAYILLNDWCTLFEDSLIQEEPPKALFSLKLPSQCLKIAQKSLNHHRGLKLLEGDFLNSFL